MVVGERNGSGTIGKGQRKLLLSRMKNDSKPCFKIWDCEGTGLAAQNIHLSILCGRYKLVAGCKYFSFKWDFPFRI